jgi:ATP-dependent Clp protease ATP-binding subunit ClpA
MGRIRTHTTVSRDPLTMLPGGPHMPWPPEDPRYAPDAREALAEAQRAAAQNGHNHVGAPHIFVGAIAVLSGAVADDIRGIGLTDAAARTALQSIMGTSGEFPIDDVTLTPFGQSVVERGLFESQRMHQPQAHAEHLALAVLRRDDGFTPRMLATLGIEPSAVIDAIVRHLNVPPTYRVAENATATEGPYERFGAEARQMLALAREEAIAAHERGINPHYFVLGLARAAEDGSPGAQRILTTLGVTAARIREEIGKLQIARGIDQPAEPWLSALAKLVIEHAIHNAGGGIVRPEHLLVALDTASDQMTLYVLKQIGVSPERLRTLLDESR